jgi:hypothetical protein
MKYRTRFSQPSQEVERRVERKILVKKAMGMARFDKYTKWKNVGRARRS